MVPTFCSLTPSSNSISNFTYHHPYLHILDQPYTTMKDLKTLHAHLIKTGLIHQTLPASRILAFSASPSGDINYAHYVFSQIQNKNHFTWNTIIRGFSQSSSPHYAIHLFIQMLIFSNIQPQYLTYPSVFRAYALCNLAHYGKQLHGRVIKERLQFDPFIRNTMLYMYVVCGYLNEAWMIFNEDVEFDVIAWNSMIIGLAIRGEIEEALKLFDEMPERNTKTWNSMISGFVRNGKYIEALNLFREMQENKIHSNEFTMVSLLNACACLGAIRQGKWIHEHIVKNGFEMNPIVVTAIINMYCKCGYIEEAILVFKTEKNKQLSCWNSLILGLANNGFEVESIELFSELVESSSFEPDDVSFISVLTACSNLGMVNKAKEYFDLMTNTYKIGPSIKHYNCMVDVLGKAGLLEEAEDMIMNMDVAADVIIWGSLLSACRNHGNVVMAERVALRVNELDPHETCGHVLMSNIYAGSSMFEEAIEQRVLMKRKDMEKEVGGSLIEVDGEVHEFVSGGRMHLRAPEIYVLLNELGRNGE